MSVELSFEDCWRAPAATSGAVSGPSQIVLKGGEYGAADLGSAERVLVSGARLVIDRPCSDTRLLVLDAVDTGARLSAFPGLQALVLWPRAPWKLDPPHGAGLRADEASPQLIDVIAPGLFVERLDSCRMRRLKLTGLADVRGLELPDLEWLSMTPKGSAAKVLKPMENLTRLELDLEASSLARLSLLGPKPQLTDAVFLSNGLKSLEGIEGWASLRRLLLHRPGISDLDPLAGSAVARLEIVAPKASVELAPLSRMGSLVDLDLRLFQHVDSIGEDWSAAVELRSIGLGECRLATRSLDGLALAPALKHVWTNAVNVAAIERLRQARPDIEVTLADEAVAVPPRGGLVAVQQDDEGWFIRQDIADLVGCPTNHDAEDLVRRELDTGVLATIEFDTEAEAFGARSQRRDAMNSVVDAIRAITV